MKNCLCKVMLLLVLGLLVSANDSALATENGGSIYPNWE